MAHHQSPAGVRGCRQNSGRKARSSLNFAEDSGEESSSSMDTDIIMKGSTKDPELKKMMKRFAALVGKVETLDQVAAASQWMTSMQCTDEDIRKFKTFNAHAENVGLGKVWAEIIMYRLINQISTYLLSGQNIRHDYAALDELEVSVAGWVRLGSEGRLGRLEGFTEIEDGEGQYSSHAERFRAFLAKYKEKEKFKKWNYDRLKMLRYNIFKVIHEIDGQNGRPMLPSDPAQTQLERSQQAETVFRESLRRGACRSSTSEEGRATVKNSRESNTDSVSETTPNSRTASKASHNGPARTSASREDEAKRGHESDILAGNRASQRAPQDTTNLVHDYDEDDPEQMTKRYHFLRKSLPAALEAYKNAQATALNAKSYYGEFDEGIFQEVQNILRDGRGEGEEWTVNAVRAQAERFAELGELVKAKLEEDLLKPLVEEENASEELQKIQEEMAELVAKLNERGQPTATSPIRT